MFVGIAVAVTVVIVGCAYRSIKPPPPKVCGVTSPRVKLSDGRHLAYREHGVPKDDAKYKIILVHGFNGSKDHPFNVSQELIKDHNIYFLHFDRAGYGDSDPNPSRTVKSEAFDVQELADKLHLGSKFYVLGHSLGGYTAWSCLNYIPDSLAGVSLTVPFVNYWWSGFPSKLHKHAFRKLPVRDQWTFMVAHYTPLLFYWWVNQKWFPASNIVPSADQQLSITSRTGLVNAQQGVHESLYRDVMAGFGKWEFSPVDMKNPFQGREGCVDIWQGYEDPIVQFEINRYIAEKLPWINYHEIPDRGHNLTAEQYFCDAIIKSLIHK